MSGAGLIELLAARLGGRGVRRASPSLREALVDLSARSAEPGVAGQEEALRQAYGRLSMEMPTENLRLPTSRVSLDDLPDVGPGWRDKDKVAHYADLLAQSEPPPIMIARDARNGAWDVIDGNHRLEVMRAAGRREIPAMDATGAFKGRYVSSDAMPPKAAPRRTGPDAGPVQGGRLPDTDIGGGLRRLGSDEAYIDYRAEPYAEEWFVTHQQIDDPAMRGQGLGVSAYEELIGRAREAGASAVVSDTRVSGDARRVYEALRRRGYSVVERDGRFHVSTADRRTASDGPRFRFAGESRFGNRNYRVPLRDGIEAELKISPEGGVSWGLVSEGGDWRGLSAAERSDLGLRAMRGIQDALVEDAGRFNVQRYGFEGSSESRNSLYQFLTRNADQHGFAVGENNGLMELRRSSRRTAPGGPAQAGRDADGVRVYHGTTRDFADFSTGNVSNGATQDAPMALFFAENPETARIYSRSSAVDARSSSARFRDVANGVAPDQRQQLLELAARKERHEALISQARERLNAIDEANGGFASPITPERRAAQRELQQLLDSPPITNAEVRAAMRPRVVEARLNMRNPRRVDMRNQDWSEDLYASEIEAARRAGNDGVIFEGVREPGAPADNVYAVFDTSRISRSGPNAGSDRNALQRALRERMERE